MVAKDALLVVGTMPPMNGKRNGSRNLLGILLCRYVWVVWTRQGKKQDNAEEDTTFAGRRTYTWNVDEMVPLARARKRDERVGLEPKEANDAVHAVVDFTAEDAEEQWLPHGSGHPEVNVEKEAVTSQSAAEG